MLFNKSQFLISGSACHSTPPILDVQGLHKLGLTTVLLLITN